MSYSPPIPPGNQSPFPRREPPHSALPIAATSEQSNDVKPEAAAQRGGAGEVTALAVTAFVAGAGAIAAAAYFLFRGKPAAAAPAKRAPRKPRTGGGTTKRRTRASEDAD